MRRRQLNQPQCFSSGPSQLPNEGPAKSTATKSLKNSARQPLAELATHGAGQVSSPGPAVPCQPARTPLTSNTVAPLSHRKMGEGTESVAFRSFSQRFAIFRQSQDKERGQKDTSLSGSIGSDVRVVAGVHGYIVS